mgnify:CR=1 FL=1
MLVLYLLEALIRVFQGNLRRLDEGVSQSQSPESASALQARCCVGVALETRAKQGKIPTNLASVKIPLPARGWGVVWLVISLGLWAGGVCYLVLHVGGHLDL